MSIVLGLLLAALLAAPAAAAGDRVTVVFHPGGFRDDSRTVFERLAARPDLSLGWLGATQGPYSVRQTLLDMSQGSRLSRSGFRPGPPPVLRLEGRRIAGWDAAVARARTAPARIVPGLLAQSIPGGAAYAGVDRAHMSHVEAIVAADERGLVGEVSLGPESDLVGRARALLHRHRLVVVNLAAGPDADRALDELRRTRSPGELLLVIRTPPRSRITQLLPTGAVGLAPGPAGLLTSRTTRRDGLVASHDVLPTVLGHLAIPVAPGVRGRPFEVSRARDRDVAYLRRLERRLRVVSPRRFAALRAVAAGVLLAGLLLVLLRRRQQAKRVCGLAYLYVPLVSLAAAALAPSRTGELLAMSLGTVALALLTDLLVRWPRAPAVPALAATVAYMVDLAFGSPLIVRSLLGPNPRFGARWYGIGNELEAVLPVLLLVGIAAVAGHAARSVRLAAALGVPMLVLGAMVGAGRLGADVGGVITIGAAGAAAVVLALPGGLTRRRIVVACAIPVIGLAGLAAIDLLTGGDSHFVSTVLDANGAGDIADVVRRRTELAVRSFLRGLMPVATVISLAALVYAVRRRERLYAAVADRPAWGAALGGGAAGGVIGSLANDSGPVLLVISVAALAAATAYIRGRPEGQGEPTRIQHGANRAGESTL
jgi:hypothetical protein